MSLQEDFQFMKDFFAGINKGENPIPNNPDYPHLHTPNSDRIEIDNGIFVPRATQVVHALRTLKQRMDTNQEGSPLVGRFRAEVVERKRPKFSVSKESIDDSALKTIAEIGGKPSYSNFQVAGWKKVLNLLQSQDKAMVITAPTGTGKSEVFMLPLIYQVAKAVTEGRESPHILFLYPRRILAQDQIQRLFRYTLEAIELFRIDPEKITIGLQIHGIWAELESTLASQTFSKQNGQYYFKLLDTCPWCGASNHPMRYEPSHNDPQVYYLTCTRCLQKTRVSLSKKDHGEICPNIMISTAEALKRMYLEQYYSNYLPKISTMVLDEAHLYNQIYGAHVYHLLQRIKSIVQEKNRTLTYIASSATIADPQDFAAKLFFGSSDHADKVIWHDSAEDGNQETVGIEYIYFLQTPNDKVAPISTMIQSIMAMGHGLLQPDQRMIVFADSLGLVNRLRAQVKDAETNRELWRFRIDNQNRDLFGLPNNRVCPGLANPNITPARCEIYQSGECWRGIIGGRHCYLPSIPIINRPLNTQVINSSTTNNQLKDDVIFGTSALEVGVDDETVMITGHYRPPRSVANFIQRRGRAGRRVNTISHSFMVLGQSSTDFFYLLRRHRLLGNFALPLNPQNPIVKQIHEITAQARKEVFEFIAESGNRPLVGTWNWVFHRLKQCIHVYNSFKRDIIAIERNDGHKEKIQIFHNWVTTKRKEYAKLILKGDQDTSPVFSLPETKNIWQELNELYEMWLSGEPSKVVGPKLENLYEKTSKLIGAKPSSVLLGEITDIVSKIETFRDLLQSSGHERRNLERTMNLAWYEFFYELERLFDDEYKPNIIPDVVESVLRALYMLHADMDESESCPATIKVNIPSNYFTPTADQLLVRIQGDSNVYQEPMTYLEALFFPYRVEYRYGEEQRMYTLATMPASDTSDPKNRLIRPFSRGLWLDIQDDQQHKTKVCRVKEITLQEIKTDASQQVGVCPVCYRLHDVDRAEEICVCGGQIVKARVQARPFVEYKAVTNENGISILNRFEFIPSLEASTLLKGSGVTFQLESGEWKKVNFYLYPKLYYQITTRGISWRLPDSPISNNPLERRNIVRTAGRILLRSMASICGVAPELLEVTEDLESCSITVWERVEGGIGLSEIFRDVVSRDPQELYQEMVLTVACPIFLSEQRDQIWPGGEDQLAAYLSDQFYLPKNHPTIQHIVKEALAEFESRPHEDPDFEPICSQEDGCPACVKYGRDERDEDASEISRKLGWQIVKSCVAVTKFEEGTLAGEIGKILKYDQNGQVYLLTF